ncbi:hypothetical protein HDU96_011087 [Phlyctochytrium bullatum]|nr:hypothetical protein HDU96_011087 [Phlyctochytrium bullatum]
MWRSYDDDRYRDGDDRRGPRDDPRRHNSSSSNNGRPGSAGSAGGGSRTNGGGGWTGSPVTASRGYPATHASDRRSLPPVAPPQRQRPAADNDGFISLDPRTSRDPRIASLQNPPRPQHDFPPSAANRDPRRRPPEAAIPPMQTGTSRKRGSEWMDAAPPRAPRHSDPPVGARRDPRMAGREAPPARAHPQPEIHQPLPPSRTPVHTNPDEILDNLYILASERYFVPLVLLPKLYEQHFHADLPEAATADPAGFVRGIAGHRRKALKILTFPGWDPVTDNAYDQDKAQSFFYVPDAARAIFATQTDDPDAAAGDDPPQCFSDADPAKFHRMTFPGLINIGILAQMTSYIRWGKLEKFNQRTGVSNMRAVLDNNHWECCPKQTEATVLYCHHEEKAEAAAAEAARVADVGRQLDMSQAVIKVLGLLYYAPT